MAFVPKTAFIWQIFNENYCIVVANAVAFDSFYGMSHTEPDQVIENLISFLTEPPDPLQELLIHRGGDADTSPSFPNFLLSCGSMSGPNPEQCASENRAKGARTHKHG
jgi:hypothetical protein